MAKVDLSPAATLRRATNAYHDRDVRFIDHWENCFRYTFPSRDLSTGDTGDALSRFQYDGTSRNAAARLQNKLLTGLVPPWAPWFRLAPGIDTELVIREENDPDTARSDTQRSLDLISDVIMTHINASNFYRVMGEAVADMIVAAGVVAVEPDPDNETIQFVDVPLDQVAIVGDEHGDIRYIYHQYRMLNKSILDQHADQLSESTRKALTESDTGTSSILVSVEWDSDRDKYIKRKFFWERGDRSSGSSGGGVAPASSPQAASGSDMLTEVELDYNPYHVMRWSSLPNNPYGEGPAMKAEADMRTLNNIMQAFLQMLNLNANGAWTAVDDDVFDPYTLDIRSGTIIPVSSNDNQNPSLRRLDIPTNVQAVGLGIEDLRSNIREQFFESDRTPSGRTPLSATEILERSDETAREMGGSFGILTSEFLIPMISTIMHILGGYDKYKELFEEVKLDGVEFTIDFLGTIARAQKKREGNEMLSVVNVNGQMGQLHPESPLLLKHNDVLRDAYKSLGVEDRFIRNETELQAEIQKAQQGAAAAQQLAGQGQTGVPSGPGQAGQGQAPQ